MSHSFRHIPRGGITTCESEKQDKRKANRKFRRLVRIAIALGREILPAKREVTDIWSFGKDGKKYHGFDYPELLRK